MTPRFITTSDGEALDLSEVERDFDAVDYELDPGAMGLPDNELSDVEEWV